MTRIGLSSYRGLMVRKRLLAPTPTGAPAGWMKLRQVFAKQKIQINSLQKPNFFRGSPRIS